MNIGVRSKLFALSLTLIACFGLASGAFLEARLRVATEAQLQRELLEDVQLAQLALTTTANNKAALAAFATAFAERNQTHVSIFDLQGKRLAESSPSASSANRDLTTAQIEQVFQNELQQVRVSSHEVADQLTVIAPYPGTDGAKGMVRLGLPLTRVDEAVAELRRLFLIAALVGLLVAGFMSMMASELISRTLRDLVKHAKAIAAGESTNGMKPLPKDEVGRLAGSVQRVAEDLQNTVSKLAAERNQLEAILLAMHDAVLVLDQHERVTIANSSAREMLGSSEVDIAGPIEDIDCASLLTPLVKEGLAGKTSSTILTLGEPSGRSVEAQVVPLENMGVVLVLHDITEMRRLETMRRDFVGNVSHELRTPVSVIRVNAETLLDGALDDVVYGRRFAERILRSAERLSHLVTDLLDLSRIEAGRYATKMDRISVAASVSVVRDDVQVRAAERDITLDLDVPKSVIAQGDATALEQILQNLLDNAISYSNPGGTVQVRADYDSQDRVHIEVQDNGPGIGKEHHARVFERFYRVDAGRSRDVGGTGLGLSIVKHLVESMSGEVGVNSPSEGGTLFWLTLPRPPQSLAPQLDSAETASS